MPGPHTSAGRCTITSESFATLPSGLAVTVAKEAPFSFPRRATLYTEITSPEPELAISKSPFSIFGVVSSQTQCVSLVSQALQE